MDQSVQFYNWLNQNLDQDIFESIYDYSYFGTLYSTDSKKKDKLNERLFRRYYNNNNDLDLDLNLDFLMDYLKVHDNFYENDDSDPVLKSINLYNEDYFYRSVYIPPASNRAHCSYLFKQIMDYSANNKITIPKLKYDDDGNLLKIKSTKIKLFDNKMKNNFYRLCYNKS
jgi:hypothetical protein